MKKSSQVPASLIVTLAASIVAGGCSSRNAMGQCMDAQGHVLPDSACRMGGVRGAHWVHTGGFGSSGSSGSFGS